MPEGQCEELRLALVMNGGVSLAVWMGGVTNEIHRLVCRAHPVYDELLKLTHTVAKVDVISGTSAGGINGAALGLALVYQGNFASLRDVWLSSGAFETLLRTPLGGNSGSLLRGEEYFLPALEDAFLNLVGNKAHPAAQPEDTPLDLRLTTTLLSGRQGNSVDDLGTPLSDVDYRAHFEFKFRPGDTTDFSDPRRVIPALARAARSTSSFPFAFEPSAVPPDLPAGCLKDAMGRQLTQRGNGTGTGTVPPVTTQGTTRPSIPAWMTEKRHVVDGGVLDNKPIRGALSAIFSMPRTGSVRRVLAYINPDPGDGPPAKLGPDTKMPTLGAVMSASVLGIPQSQTISDQLSEIAHHNRRVRTRRDSLLDVVNSLVPDDSKALASKLFAVYRERRLASAFEIFVYDNLRFQATNHSDLAPGLTVFSKNNRASLQRTFAALDWQGWLPNRWQGTSQAPESTLTHWGWGLFPVEFAITVLMELLRMTQSILVVKDGLTIPSTPLPSQPQQSAPSQATGYDWSDDDPPVDSDAVSLSHNDKSLASIWKKTYGLIGKINGQRKLELENWASNSRQLLSTWIDKGPAATAGARADFEEMFKFLGAPNRKQICGEMVYAIAACIAETAAVANNVLAAVPITMLSDADCELKADVESLVRFLCGASSDQSEIVFRLLQLEVIQYAFADRDEMNENTMIEMVQISGNAKSPLSNHANAREKLLGLQVAHFGAFYKASWRANDWIYGRLDCSERLVNVLLNPERLRRFYSSPAAIAVLSAALPDHQGDDPDNNAGGPCAVYVARRVKQISLLSVKSQALRDELDKRWAQDHLFDNMIKELAFLDDMTTPLPDALPACAIAITLRLHYGILRTELPVLKGAIIKDQSVGAEAFGPGAALLRTLSRTPQPMASKVPNLTAAAEGLRDNESGIFTPEEARRSLEDGLIAAETLQDEASSDLFLRTITHSLVATQSTLAIPGLGPITAFFAWVRLPTLGFYFVARGITHQSRTSAALNGGMLTLGAFILILQFFWNANAQTDNNLPHLVVALGWAFFAYGLFMNVIRAPRMTAAIFLLIGAVITLFFFHLTPGLVLLAALAVLMFLSIWSVLLQWALGMAFIVLIGLWGAMPEAILPVCSTALFRQGFGVSQCHWLRLSQPAAVLSIAVALTLALAILQAMPWPRQLAHKLSMLVKRAR